MFNSFFFYQNGKLFCLDFRYPSVYAAICVFHLNSPREKTCTKSILQLPTQQRRWNTSGLKVTQPLTWINKQTNKQNTLVVSMRDIKIKSYLRISSLAGGRVCSRHPYWTTLQQKIFWNNLLFVKALTGDHVVKIRRAKNCHGSVLDMGNS